MTQGLQNTTEVKCDQCDGTVFTQALKIRKQSALVSESGKTTYQPIPIFTCNECGHINGEFLPQERKPLPE